MQNLKVSVIVPVYKAESYLHRCVDSLLAQTLKEFEILLVDDGSPDRSGEICDEYAQKDHRVRVFHKPNGGVSSARQKGLDEARGEYVIHADPDDWVDKTMLAELYGKAKRDDADMVICDYYSHYKQYVRYNCQKPSSLDNEVIIRELFQQLHGSCCNKLVRRVCYNEYGVRFPKEISYSEDVYTNISLLIHPIKVTYLDMAFYHYDQASNPNSLVGQCTALDFQRNEVLLRLLDDVLNGLNVREYVESAMSKSILWRTFLGNFFSSVEFREKTQKYMTSAMRAPFDANSLYLYFSSLGFYKPMYFIWKSYHLVGHHVKEALKFVKKKLCKILS